MNSITQMSELLKGLPRGWFDRTVEREQADKHNKGLSTWKRLIVMCYSQLSGMDSLRQIEQGFNAQRNHHYHLNVGQIKRSALSNANRSGKGLAVFEAAVQYLMSQVSRSIKRELKEVLYLLDSSPIQLTGRGLCEWTQDTKTSRLQGQKLHAMLDAQTGGLVWYDITAANINDVSMVNEIELQANARYVFDKGYCDYAWWHRIHQAGSFYVTRLKKNAALTLEQTRMPVGEGVISDEWVRFTHRNNGGGRAPNPYMDVLRRITIERENKTPLVLVTNDLTSSALTIGAQYRARWGIELLFKWVKQHLNIKKFLGTNEYAVRVQILTALITHLLVILYHNRMGFKGSLFDCLTHIKATLFQRCAVQTELLQRRRLRMAEYAKMQPCLL
jgi:IS4 transposase